MAHPTAPLTMAPVQRGMQSGAQSTCKAVLVAHLARELDEQLYWIWVSRNQAVRTVKPVLGSDPGKESNIALPLLRTAPSPAQPGRPTTESGPVEPVLQLCVDREPSQYCYRTAPRQQQLPELRAWEVASAKQRP